jgi:hypothetical protein
MEAVVCCDLWVENGVSCSCTKVWSTGSWSYFENKKLWALQVVELSGRIQHPLIICARAGESGKGRSGESSYFQPSDLPELGMMKGRYQYRRWNRRLEWICVSWRESRVGNEIQISKLLHYSSRDIWLPNVVYHPHKLVTLGKISSCVISTLNKAPDIGIEYFS